MEDLLRVNNEVSKKTDRLESRQRRGCGVAVSVLVLCLLCILWFGIFEHDYRLWRMGRTFAGVQHPAGTRHVKSYRQLGLLIADSNHVDYFVGELRTYTGSREDVIRRYSSQKFWSDYEQCNLPVEVLFLDKGRVEAGILYHGEIGFQLPYPVDCAIDEMKKHGRPADHLYFVYIFDPGYSPGLDGRGM